MAPRQTGLWAGFDLEDEASNFRFWAAIDALVGLVNRAEDFNPSLFPPQLSQQQRNTVTNLYHAMQASPLLTRIMNHFNDAGGDREVSLNFSVQCSQVICSRGIALERVTHFQS